MENSRRRVRERVRAIASASVAFVYQIRALCYATSHALCVCMCVCACMGGEIYTACHHHETSTDATRTHTHTHTHTHTNTHTHTTSTHARARNLREIRARVPARHDSHLLLARPRRWIIRCTARSQLLPECWRFYNLHLPSRIYIYLYIFKSQTTRVKKYIQGSTLRKIHVRVDARCSVTTYDRRACIVVHGGIAANVNKTKQNKTKHAEPVPVMAALLA